MYIDFVKDKESFDYYVNEKLNNLWLDTLHDDLKSIIDKLTLPYINDNFKAILTELKLLIEVRLLELLEKEFYSDIEQCKNSNKITEDKAMQFMSDKQYYKDFGNYLNIIISKREKTILLKEFKK